MRKGPFDQAVTDVDRTFDVGRPGCPEDLATGGGEVIDIEFRVLVEYFGGQNDLHDA